MYIPNQPVEWAMFLKLEKKQKGPAKLSYGVIWLLCNCHRTWIIGLTKVVVRMGCNPTVCKHARIEVI